MHMTQAGPVWLALPLHHRAKSGANGRVVCVAVRQADRPIGVEIKSRAGRAFR